MNEDPRRQLIQPVIASLGTAIAANGQMAKPAVTPLAASWVSLADSLSGAPAYIGFFGAELPLPGDPELLVAADQLLVVPGEPNLFRRAEGLTANTAANVRSGVALASTPPGTSLAHTPAANTLATIETGSGGDGTCFVVTSIAATLCALAAAAETALQLVLRDGDSGAGGAILWSQTLMVIPGRMTQVALAGLAIPSNVNNGVNLQFSAAGGANTFESVALTGFYTN